MGNFVLLQIGLTVLFSTFLSTTADLPPEEHKAMIGAVETIFQIACTVKYPQRSGKEFQSCLEKPKEFLSPKDLVKWINTRAPNIMPTFHSKCSQYTKEDKFNAPAPADESEALSDKGKKYPLQAYAHCVVDSIRKEKGDGHLRQWSPQRSGTFQIRFAAPTRDWLQEFLDAENKYRARHDTPPVVLMESLNEEAQQYAEVLAKNCKMKHSSRKDRKGAGENLGWQENPGHKDEIAGLCAKAWYDEIKYYPYPGGYNGTGEDEVIKKMGHFTQLIWKETTQVGYGIATSSSCSWSGLPTHYCVARYAPPGNVIGPGSFQRNVLPLKKDS